MFSCNYNEEAGCSVSETFLIGNYKEKAGCLAVFGREHFVILYILWFSGCAVIFALRTHGERPYSKTTV